MNDARETAERVARDSYGRLVAFLAARTRDVAGAEDALAEAFTSALDAWPRTGVPDNPHAWLLTVARRRQIDGLRRRGTSSGGEAHLHLIADEIEQAALHPEAIPDRRLALMFACAHPAIERGMRTPLILQTVLGFTAEQIAAAFLVSPATMGQRLVRAKTRIRQAGIPFEVPGREALAERIDAVLDAIYAIYTRGWTEMGEVPGEALGAEAIFLGQLVVGLLPDIPEARGMLALMLYAEARRPARLSAEGEFTPLDRQRTELWDDRMIAGAERLLRAASADGPSGRFQLEAAIQSAHVARLLRGQDSWPAIVMLYDHLYALIGSPVVALNRAVAIGARDGAAAGLEALAEIDAVPAMRDYQPYWAARGHLLAEAGRKAEAREALSVAAGLSTDPILRRYLQKRVQALVDG